MFSIQVWMESPTAFPYSMILRCSHGMILRRDGDEQHSPLWTQRNDCATARTVGPVLVGRMKMATTELTAADVANRVRPYVAKKRVGDITLSMDDARIHLRNGYWRIPIRPSREPNPHFPYYEALANLED